MKNEYTDDTSTQRYVEELRLLARSTNEDDLPGLAKMHDICERLVGAALHDDAGVESELNSLARKLSTLLEAVILGEVENAHAAMAEILAQISTMERLVIPTPSDGDRAPFDTVENGDSIAAKLDRVFEDDGPSSTDESAMNTPMDTPENGPERAEPELCSNNDASESPPTQPLYISEPLLIDDSQLEIIEDFVEEAYEHIEAAEAAVLEIEHTPEDTDTINALFRSFHTIKCAAGFLGLCDINSLTHEVETILDQVRKGNRSITPGLIDLIFDVVDVLKVQVAGIRSYLANPTGKEIPQPVIVDMISSLRDIISGRMEPIGSQPEGGSPHKKVGENLVEQRTVAQEVVDFAVQQQQSQPGSKKLGETLIEMGVTTPKQVSRALRPQANKKSAEPEKDSDNNVIQSVRIDTTKLDALVDMVGELVIAQTQVSANPKVTMDPKLTKDVTHTNKIVRDVQELAMAIRMIPIGPTFQKMVRLVRDVSHKVGKRVELIIFGENTRLDKNVIQQVSDPLIHMIRNAVDHGIESPEARRAAGKPEVGQVHLAASHQGGNIVIEIRDDGKGLDPKSLIEKGIKKGLVQPDASLSDEQAYQLIFRPGFSMAEEVTGISGRGVGMDVVRRNIEQLRGKVEITSQLGKGTTFSIQLPLTLAIIDGMVLRVGTERFIIQTITVEQALRPRPEQITTVQHKGEILNIRGRLIPLVQLGSLFGLIEPVDPCEKMVVIARCDEGDIGLVVDELLGQQQVVIKSLGERFRGLRGVSGAAILGDGRISLILEMSGIAALHNTIRVSHIRSNPADSVMSSNREPIATDHEKMNHGLNNNVEEFVTV